MKLTQHVFRQAITLLELQAGDRILELGCGDGWACRMLAERIAEGLVIGLDPSDDQIRDARMKSTAFENILYLWSAAEQIPWQEDFFTGVLCVDSLHQFQDVEKALREAYRVLAPAGTLWIVNQRLELAAVGTIPSDLPSNRPAGAGPLDSEQCFALLRAAGFDDVASHSVPDSIAPSRTSFDEPASPAGALLLSARKPQK